MLKIPWRCSCQRGADFGRLAEQRARREMIDRTFMEGNRFPADGQDTMALLFQHMVSVGMVNANALQSISTAPAMYISWSNYQHFGWPSMATMAPGRR